MHTQILADAREGKSDKRVLEGEILPAEPIASDQVSRVRGALTAAAAWPVRLAIAAFSCKRSTV